jgi:hypothetical protein
MQANEIEAIAIEFMPEGNYGTPSAVEIRYPSV